MLYFFCLIFVINGVPGEGSSPPWGCPGVFRGVLSVFWGCFLDIPGVFLGRGGSGPVPIFTDTPLFLKAFNFFYCG